MSRPLLTWTEGYQRAWLPGDLASGVLVVAIAIPLSMGMAEVAGVPPVTGLYTCVLPLIAYACVGASRHLVIGLDASTAAMLAAAVAPLAGGDSRRYLALAGGLTMMAGVVLLLAGSLHLGRLTALLSNPGLLGYQAGLGVIVIINQLHRLLGVQVTETEPLPRATQIASRLGQVHGWTVTLGLAALTLVIVLRIVRPSFPGALVAVAAATAVVGVTALADRGVALVGEIPAGLPRLALPDITVGDATALLVASAGIALVAAADTIATARAFAVRNGYRLNTNRELVALGTANVMSGASGGITASASAARTAVAEASGGRTPLASAVAGITLALVLVFFTGPLEAVPTVALAAVVIAAVARIIDVPAVVRLARVRPSEAAIAVATLVAVVAAGTLEGIGVAIGLSLGDALYRRLRGGHGATTEPGVAPSLDPAAALRLSGPLFYANAEQWERQIADRADRVHRDEVLVNVAGVTDIDATAADTLRNLALQLHRQQRSLRLTGVTFPVAELLDSYGLAALVDQCATDRPNPCPVSSGS